MALATDIRSNPVAKSQKETGRSDRFGNDEPRLTSMMLKIMGVNVGALIILMIGVIYLGNYQERLIETKLENFRNEAVLTKISIENSPYPFTMISKIHQMTKRRIVLFNESGELIRKWDEVDSISYKNKKDNDFDLLKFVTARIYKYLSRDEALPLYVDPQSRYFDDYQEAHAEHTEDIITISAWLGKEDFVFLSSTADVYLKNGDKGILVLSRTAADINEDISATRKNVFLIFLGSALFTLLLSIYLSGVIGKPLKALAMAAENVRLGKADMRDIPDFSDRHDEIGDLSVALRDMASVIDDRMKAIEHFAADVAHELKNPITSLKSAVETLNVAKTMKDKKRLHDVILHDLERLDRLISDISKASRIDNKLARKQFEKLDVQRIIDELLQEYDTPLSRKTIKTGSKNKKIVVKDGVKIVFQPLMEEERLFVMAHETLLLQALDNIVSNAISFSPKNGSVKIKLKNDNGIIIQISDEGDGIPEDKLENIFERFYTQRPEGHAYGNNSGLGLSITKNIIESFDGSVSVYNNKKAGCTFTITLPRAKNTR